MSGMFDIMQHMQSDIRKHNADYWFKWDVSQNICARYDLYKP